MLYIHSGSKNEIMVNGKPAELFASGPGEIENLKDGQWGIVLSLDCPLQEGSFMEIGTDGPVFCVGEPAGTSFRLETARGGFVSLSEKVAMLRPMRVGILTVSDKGSRGERKDTAGPALAELVVPLGAVVARKEIVPDDRLLIAETLRRWADLEGLQLVLLTGGTGLSGRDVTPEALQDVAERIVPGLGEAMRRKTEPLLDRSILSRSLAITRGKCLVIAFPGSERGARQCFESIAGVLRHAVEILNGWEGECAAHHKQGHSHG
jgi:molybdenum cofactor synthesis domain-containing protein